MDIMKNAILRFLGKRSKSRLRPESLVKIPVGKRRVPVKEMGEVQYYIYL